MRPEADMRAPGLSRDAQKYMPLSYLLEAVKDGNLAANHVFDEAGCVVTSSFHTARHEIRYQRIGQDVAAV